MSEVQRCDCRLCDHARLLAERDAEIARLRFDRDEANSFLGLWQSRAERAEAAWDHLCANTYDHHSPGMICIPVSEWKAAEGLRAVKP